MDNHVFTFRQFSLSHGKSTIKVGTDAVLLGIWAKPENSSKILDAGTGCGVIALMTAQKTTNSEITAIDIHEDSVTEASENFAKSKWAKRLTAKHISLQAFSGNHICEFDQVISNPPFFSNAVLSPVMERNIARQEITLPFQDLFLHVKMILKEDGKFSLIIPFREKQKVIKLAAETKLFLHRHMDIIPKTNRQANRSLLEFSAFSGMQCVYETLTIRNTDNTYTSAFKNYTKDFYLDFPY